MPLLRQCGTSKLLRACGTGKLLRACPAPPEPEPKDICTEFGLDPYLLLKFTWSGTLNRCTDCWDLNEANHWQCINAPTSLPDGAATISCAARTVVLDEYYVLQSYLDFCGGEETLGQSDDRVGIIWSCIDGLFVLAVIGSSPMFYGSGYNVKDGDVLANQLSCLSVVSLPQCMGSPSFPAFVTGGSYKVEIAPS